MILDARTAGLADSAAEKSFLAGCVVEIKPGKNKLPPVIPPHLQPDSISRCRWIVAQIDGGRDEMTVSYKRYCPEDCDTLQAKDSTRHVHLCHDHHNHGVDSTKPPKPPLDTLPKPPKPVDSCKIFRASLAALDSASVEAENLRRLLEARCGKPPVPPVDTTKPPKPPVDTTKPPKPVDSCKIFRASLAALDSASVEAENLRRLLEARCGKPPVPPVDTTKPPVDSLPKPPVDTTKPPKPPVDSTKPPKPPVDSLPKPPVDTTKPPKPPVDTLPKPIIVKPAPKCDDLRAKLLTLNPASEESKLLVESILEHCTDPNP